MGHIELEVGKKFIDRYGHEWLVRKCEPQCKAYPYVAYATKDGREETYTKNGRWSRHCTAGCDLVNTAPVVSLHPVSQSPVEI